VIDKPHNLDELLQWIIEQESEQISRKAFPAEMEQEEQEEKDEDINPEEEMFLDAIKEDEDIGDEQTQEAIAEEAEMLEEIPLPGRNHDERSRKREWLKLPRTARAAIRRMHMQFGHCLREPRFYHNRPIKWHCHSLTHSMIRLELISTTLKTLMGPPTCFSTWCV
jgi:hypothetical protein